MAFVSCLLAASLAASVPLRGVVEGFYGRPWGTQGRMELFDFMSGVDMNVYVYGPKDDEYHHKKWREEYPPEMAADFRALLAKAKASKIRFCWSIHLGNAFENPAPDARAAEYAALTRKLESMYAIGFRDFAVFFDDFGAKNGALHAEICNFLVRGFLAKKGDCGRLILCPNEYVGLGDDPYTKDLFASLDEAVDVIWTGPRTCSDISKKDVQTLTANRRGRAPLIWWNWPVNDFCRGKLLMGRAYGVEEAPYAGFLVNPMENLSASKLALWQVAKMTSDWKNYDSEKAWRDGVKALYPWASEAMMLFCEHNSDVSGPRIEEDWVRGWRREESVAFSRNPDVSNECARIVAAARELKEKMPANDPHLWRETKYFVELFGLLGEKGLAAARGDAPAYRRLAMRERIVSERQRAYFASLAPEWDRANCRPGVVADSVLAPAVEKLAKERFGEAGPVRISVFGDSYSTFAGFIPKGNATYYEPGEDRVNPENDVSRPEECWWHMLIGTLGGKLERNESWSGSTIGYRGYGGYDAKKTSFLQRVDRLGSPDLIFLFGGTNDAWAGVPLGEAKDADWTEEDLFTYRPALSKTLFELRRLYPAAEIVFILNSEVSKEFTAATSETCARYGVPFIRLRYIDKQGGHPSINGMRQIADQVLKAL